MELAVLALSWALWCGLHSALIWPAWTSFVGRHAPGFRRYYRLTYNAVALLTLSPVLEYKRAVSGDPLFVWDGPVGALRFVLFMAALVLFFMGALCHDLRWFAGIAQLHSSASLADADASIPLRTNGILHHVRHPWYGGALLLLWSHTKAFDGATLVTNSVLSLYVVLGAHLEERKLVQTYKDEYLAYQRVTPMFFPWTKRCQEENA